MNERAFDIVLERFPKMWRGIVLHMGQAAAQELQAEGLESMLADKAQLISVLQEMRGARE